MKRAIGFLWARMRHGWLHVVVGAACAVALVNLTAGPGVVVTDQVEAEGPQFADPGTLDLFSDVHYRRICPSMSQRYAWRYEMYQGRRIQHAIPLTFTGAPFLADDGGFLLTINAKGVPDPIDGHWKYRVVTVETCPWLPAVLSRYFGPRIFRSPDLPVNFIGAPHIQEPTP